MPWHGKSNPPMSWTGDAILSDDGFGVETLRRLRELPLPPEVELLDVGVRGVHLAYQVLDGYRRLVLIDATARGGGPGTVYLTSRENGVTKLEVAKVR